MTNEKLEAIADKSAKKLKTLICENEDDIQEAISHAYIAAQDKEHETGTPQKVKIALTHKITLDMSDNTQIDALAWSVAHKSEITSEIPDPNQPELEGIE